LGSNSGVCLGAGFLGVCLRGSCMSDTGRYPDWPPPTHGLEIFAPILLVAVLMVSWVKCEAQPIDETKIWHQYKEVQDIRMALYNFDRIHNVLIPPAWEKWTDCLNKWAVEKLDQGRSDVNVVSVPEVVQAKCLRTTSGQLRKLFEDALEQIKKLEKVSKKVEYKFYE